MSTSLGSSTFAVGVALIGEFVTYLDKPGGGLLVGVGVSWFIISRFCAECPYRKGVENEKKS